MQEYLPQVRVEDELRRKLELVAESSIATSLSVHIRLAVEEYVEKHWTPALQSRFLAEQADPQGC